ncbi:hypothetical protein [Succinispira mobilis]|uniref:hypothetical protein n=1 Tax=Succinispira mobilis TaxID=78120 RepID=UPI0003763CA7|nr:hypothetical protein [Succinispira mobilis]
MKNKFRKFQILFSIFLIIGFSIPILTFLGEYIPNPNIYKDRKANMKIEYENIIPPSGAKEIDKKTYSKVTQIWISADYQVEMSKEEIEKYYRNELSLKGWSYDKTFKDGSLEFKKGNLIVVLIAKNNEASVGLYYAGDGANF